MACGRLSDYTCGSSRGCDLYGRTVYTSRTACAPVWMSDLFLAFFENERNEAILAQEVRSCRATCRWIVFGVGVLAYEAAQLGLVRTVRRSGEVVDWAAHLHRQTCRLRSINRVRRRNGVDSDDEDTDGSM